MLKLSININIVFVTISKLKAIFDPFRLKRARPEIADNKSEKKENHLKALHFGETMV